MGFIHLLICTTVRLLPVDYGHLGDSIYPNMNSGISGTCFSSSPDTVHQRRICFFELALRAADATLMPLRAVLQ